MQFTGEDFDMYYRTIYTSNRGEDPAVIVQGTMVQMLRDYEDCFESNFILACICIVPDFLFTYLPLLIKRLVVNSTKPRFNPEKEFKINNSSEDSLVNLKHREYYNSLKDKYTPNREEKINKANNINILRKQIYTNNMELRGNLVSSNLITFGNESNEALSNLFSKEVELKTSFLSRENCVIVKNINSLENEISKLLHVDVKIVVK